MEKKLDLIKIFGLEGVVSPRALNSFSREEVMSTTPYQMSLEVKSLMDELTECINDQDIDTIIANLEAARLRVECMSEIANRMKKLIDKSKKK